MQELDWIQWPAMVITVAAAWFVASNNQNRRNIGFWLFLVSNVAWIVWGFYTQAWALVVLQFLLGAMNIRGAQKTDSESMNKPGASASTPSRT